MALGVGLGNAGSSTGATEALGDFFGDALADFLAFVFFRGLGDTLAFFFFAGVGVRSSSDCCLLFAFFVSGVSLGFGLGEGLVWVAFFFFAVAFGFGVGVSSGSDAACKNAICCDEAGGETCA